HVVDARSDVFSLGVVLYELLTYQTPFPGEDVPSILLKIINEPPEPITKYIPKCPAQLEKIVERSLAKDREERYQSASDMAFDLLRVVDGLRHDTLDVYLQQGQRLLREGDFTLAKESLQKALEIDSTHQVAQSLLAQVRDGIQARQRAEKIQSSLRGAKEALQVEQYDDAIALADEALRLDPRQEEAQKYKQRAVEQRDRAEKIRQHLERAHIHLAEKQFATALELLDQARELDPINVEVEALTRLVRSSADKDERRKLLLKRLADIEESLNNGKLDSALAAIEQAQQE